MAVGCLGFSVREFDLAAPAAVLVALGVQDARQWRGPRRHLWVYCLAGVVVLAVCGAVYLWTGHLANAQQETAGPPTASALRAVGEAYFTLAFFVSPFLPAAVRRSWRTASPKGLPGGLPVGLPVGLAVAAVVFAVGLTLLASGHGVFTGNYLAQQGMSTNASLPGGRPELFAGPVWRLLELVGVAAGSALAFVAANATRDLLRTRSRPPVSEKSIVMLFTWLSAAGLVLYGLFVRAAIFDRYVWALAFGAAVLLAAFSSKPVAVTRPAVYHEPRWGARAWQAALALLAIAVGGVIALNADAYDGARWAAGQEAVRAGFPASEVDASFDWVGSHTSAPAVRGRNVPGAASYETWYDQLFPGFKDCAFVSGSRLSEPHLSVLGAVKYKEFGFALTEHLYIYAVHSAQCATDRGR